MLSVPIEIQSTECLSFAERMAEFLLDVFLIGQSQAINQRIKALENQINFLIESIKDTQSAIRAFDVKAGTLGVLLFTPIYKIDKFAGLISNVRNLSDFEIFLFALDAFLWIFSIFLVLMSLVSISDPAEKIRGERPHGMFYGAYLFDMNWKHVSAQPGRGAMGSDAPVTAFLIAV